jgi:hypothetical protein
VEAMSMFAEDLLRYRFAIGTASLTIAVGSTVAGLVYVSLRRLVSRRRLARFSKEEDLPWDELLTLLRAREQELADSGKTPDEELPPDQLLALLLSRLPAQSGRPYEVPPEEKEFLEKGGGEKRAGRRRWGNPTQVNLTTSLERRRLNGTVINRSTGGLGIFVDQKIQPGTFVEVRPADAPRYVPSTEIEVKFCRKIRGQYLIGCQFLNEVPWNVRVWFG